jgi:amino acid transporter
MAIIRRESGATVLRREAEGGPPRTWRSWLIGRPLPTADAEEQTIGKLVGLAVFASDALSSTAYATQEILAVLAVATAFGAFSYAIPIAVAIVLLLVIVTISYEQTIHAYPSGGGAYIVARDNLGERPAQVAAAALLTDYILTVAVSISAGVAQLTSAFPALYEYRVAVAIALVAVIMILNLRGVKEAGITFAIPSYIFLVVMVVTIGVAFARYFAGTLGVVANPPELHLEEAATSLSLFLILHAFANGTTALTGVEAISNGITAFKEPRSRNAGITLMWMSGILGTLFLSITFLARQVGAVPSETETVISQLARTAYDGRGVLYLVTIAATMLILFMAANTAYAGFPRLSAMVAADGFLPRQLMYKGSRLVYSRGIIALTALACVLIVIFKASVTLLIPLYAIGVFLSFTLSQAGMAKRWLKIGRLKPGVEVQEAGSVLHYERGWTFKMIVNGFGAVCTAVVMMVFAVTKFREGAWMILLVIPILVAIFFVIHRHYRDLARALSLEAHGEPPRVARHRVILPLGGVHRGTLAALRYARTLSNDITAVHVLVDEEEAEKLQRKWETWGEGVRLVLLDSPYRQFATPLVNYIEEMTEQRQPNEVITIVVPQFVPQKWWHNVLHNQTATWLRFLLISKPGVVVTDVPYQVRLAEPHEPSTH